MRDRPGLVIDILSGHRADGMRSQSSQVIPLGRAATDSSPFLSFAVKMQVIYRRIARISVLVAAAHALKMRMVV